MKQLTLVLAVLLIGVFASAPRPAAALENWPPLLTCSDVNADGHVDAFDIGAVVVKFGTFYPSEDYLLLYDVWGGGNVDSFDIGKVVVDFGLICPSVETQVAAATLAVMKYQDPAVAAADGYVQVSQYVPSMGIHFVNITNQVNYPDCCDIGSQLEHPVGLLYAETSPGSGVAGEFIGLWYIVPVPPVCEFYGITGPCQPIDTQPVGFGETNTDEDNLDPDGSGPQRGWHTHPSLCTWGIGTTSAFTQENVPAETCANDLQGVWFSTFGWMNHLYNFIPNPAGRFQNWSCNIAGGVVGC